MAAQWSSEHFVAEYKDIQANAMAVDCVGRWALLGGDKSDNPQPESQVPPINPVALGAARVVTIADFDPLTQTWMNEPVVMIKLKDCEPSLTASSHNSCGYDSEKKEIPQLDNQNVLRTQLSRKIPVNPELVAVNPELVPVNPELVAVNPELVPVNPELVPVNPELVLVNPELVPVNPELVPVNPEIANKFSQKASSCKGETPSLKYPVTKSYQHHRTPYSKSPVPLTESDHWSTPIMDFSPNLDKKKSTPIRHNSMKLEESTMCREVKPFRIPEKPKSTIMQVRFKTNQKTGKLIKCEVCNCECKGGRLPVHIKKAHLPSCFTLVPFNEESVDRVLVALYTLAEWLLGRGNTILDLMKFANETELFEKEYSIDNETRSQMMYISRQQLWKVPGVFTFCPMNSPSLCIHWRAVARFLPLLTQAERQDFRDLFKEKESFETEAAHFSSSSHNMTSSSIDSSDDTDVLIGIDAYFNFERLEHLVCGPKETMSEVLDSAPQAAPGSEVYLEAAVIAYCDPDCWPVQLPDEGCCLLAIGVYPTKAEVLNADRLEALRHVMLEERISAFGEIGLDFSMSENLWSIQIEALKKLLLLALPEKPVILSVCGEDSDQHYHHASSTCFRLARAYLSPHQRIHLRNFSSSRDIANLWMSHFNNVYFGFSNYVRTFDQEQRECLRNLPRERILLETGAPDLPPPGHRLNSPRLLREVAEAVREVRGTSVPRIMRRALALVNLNSPKDEVVRIARQTSQAKWDINCIQFNPHACKADTFVTASNQRLEVLQLANGNTQHRCNLKSHTRTVSDIDWSPFDVNQLASCSVDTYTYLWDIRDFKKPAATFQSVAGAYQVKWNKVVNNMFATTHEGDIRIWDPRKGNTPIQYIAAHLSKIHGLDWNPKNQYKLVTASQDCFVRFWDITNVRRSEYTLNTGSPVWRARLTPFGDGLMTVVVPQLRRGENKLYLWNTRNLAHPIHTFVGHKDVVLEFHWRKQPEGVRDQQLVTWSRDQSLRIWRIDSGLQELCGHEINNLSDLSEDLRDLTVTDGGPTDEQPLPIIDESQTLSATVVSQSESAVMASNRPQTLQQEFSLVNKNIPNVTIDEMDAINRVCRMTAQIGKRTVSLNLIFPNNYPNNASPSFQFLHTTLDSNMQKQLIKVLTETSQKHVKRNMNCLEPCLRQLIAELDSLTKTERKTPDLDIPFPLTQQQNMMQATPIYPMYSFGSFQDSSVPFPRTSGARFCSVGLLVMFGRPADIKKKVADGAEPTPKALSELAAFAKRSQNPTAFNALFPRSPPTPSNEGVSISDFYTYKERKHRTRSRSRVREVSESRHRDTDKPAKKPTKVGPVKVYDVSALLTVHKQLAESYKLDLSDIPGMCAHNAAAAAAVGRKDLVQIWNYVSVMLPASQNPSPTPTSSPPFAMCAFGRPFLKTMLDHYRSYYDVQTLAMLCCVFWKKEDMQKNVRRTSSKSSMEYTPANYNPYHTVSSVTNLLKGFKAKSHAQSQAPSGHPGPQVLTAHGAGPLSEVASHPNLSALFKQAVLKNKRSNSWSESCDDYRILDEQDPAEKAAQRELEQHENNCRMLDPNLWYQYDLHKKAYANILYCWGLHNQAAHILKFISTPPPPHKGIEFCVKCARCLREVRGPQCTSCKHFVLECVICHLGVRGAANFCIGCSHGGHTEHLANWFRTQHECPTGCGCECLKVTPMLATA